MNFTEKENGFYYIEDFEELAYITYYRNENVLYINHTYVDSSLRGKGIANALVLKVIDYAKDNNYKIFPICSYVVNWFSKNPEFYELLLK